MIDFTTVTREFRSLIGRRRELQTLLGSVFAGLGIFLQNSLEGKLPAELGSIHRHVFAFYAILLMVPSLILALRMARLHAGLVLTGILYARCMQEQDFTSKPSIARAARHNFTGVSFVQFVLMDLIAGFSTTILALALLVPGPIALVLGGSVVLVWFGLYLRFHDRAAKFAMAKVAAETCGPFTRDDWEAHISGSLEDANTGLNTDVAFVGLIVFSVFESLSGLGQVKADGTDLAPAIIQKYAPIAYVGLMLLTCLIGLVSYVRVRIAVGRFSLMLDPTDRPFRPFKLTDSLLGYLIIAFLFTVSLHLMLGLFVPAFKDDETWLLAIDALVMILAVGAEQVTLVVAGRANRRIEAPPRVPG